jgi:hypothetical protein
MVPIQKLILALSVGQTLSFVLQSPLPISQSRPCRQLWSTTIEQEVLPFSLEKPLGMILEEGEF